MGQAAITEVGAARPAGAVPAETPAEPLIETAGLGKRFKIYARPADRMLEWATGNRVRRHSDFWAVRGVSFAVGRGECLGIIGANGSGKSTLLKMITGALYPTEGVARVRGRSLSLLDLGTGMNPQLSGRQNVINAARMLAFPPAYAREHMERIRAFADLGEFFDRAVGLYSAGMRVRLSFSMFACFEPDVFIVDEALAVGDVFFQQKCAARLREMLDGGMTMLFVSHDQGAILNLCDRAVLLERGRAVFEGEPAEALSRYTASLRGQRVAGGSGPGQRAHAAPTAARLEADDAGTILAHDVIGERSAARFGSGGVRVRACRVTDQSGRDSLRAGMGEPLLFHLLLEASEPVERPRAGLHLVDRFSNLLFACGTRMVGHVLPPMRAGDRLIVRLDVTMDLAPGEYAFSVNATEPPENDPEVGLVLDQVADLGPVRVVLDRSRPRPFHGAARLPVRVAHRLLAGGDFGGGGAP